MLSLPALLFYALKQKMRKKTLGARHSLQRGSACNRYYTRRPLSSEQLLVLVFLA